jgi:hypothetical protein
VPLDELLNPDNGEHSALLHRHQMDIEARTGQVTEVCGFHAVVWNVRTNVSEQRFVTTIRGKNVTDMGNGYLGLSPNFYAEREIKMKGKGIVVSVLN